ncbi:hypothetical protein D3C80_1494990 [compost metagenome]
MRLMPEASSSSSWLPSGGRRVCRWPSLSWATLYLICRKGSLMLRLMRRASMAVTVSPALISSRLASRLR